MARAMQNARTIMAENHASASESTPAVSFQHERELVYQCALTALELVDALLAGCPAGRSHQRQRLDRAVTTLVVNAAKGAEKVARWERQRFYQLAHGAAVDLAAVIDVLVQRGDVSQEPALATKIALLEVVTLMQSSSADDRHPSQPHAIRMAAEPPMELRPERQGSSAPVPDPVVSENSHTGAFAVNAAASASPELDVPSPAVTPPKRATASPRAPATRVAHSARSSQARQASTAPQASTNGASLRGQRPPV